MFRVEDERHGTINQVFTWQDPRKAGYKGSVVEEGVTLDYNMEAVHSWPDGEKRPEACLGRDPKNPKHYKVFKYGEELNKAGYELVPGTAVPFEWDYYTRLHLVPPDPEQTSDEQWYKYLDDLDEDSRRRRQREQAPDKPAGTSRDEVAAWVAKTHLLVDASIREVWYLPQGAPNEEIRLLELSDRLAGPDGKAAAIDFGLDVEGAPFRLFVADITSEQLDQIKHDPSYLPVGWSLDGNMVWRRGA